MFLFSNRIWGGGFLGKWGVVDFAGGIVIHTSSGVASLILSICSFLFLSFLYQNINFLF